MYNVCPTFCGVGTKHGKTVWFIRAQLPMKFRKTHLIYKVKVGVSQNTS